MISRFNLRNTKLMKHVHIYTYTYVHLHIYSDLKSIIEEKKYVGDINWTLKYMNETQTPNKNSNLQSTCNSILILIPFIIIT